MHAIINAVHKYLSFIHLITIMTSLQFTQVHGLGYTRGTRASFFLPHALGAYDLAAYTLHQLY